MKKTLLLLILTIFSYCGFAQNGLLVHSNEKGMYVMHTVNAKENFYSIGRLYAISPKDIAAFNGFDMANGLSIGQSIMIPLNATNFSQTDEKGTPVYYEVGDKEGLYRVSLKNNKVLMANLRKWNHLTSDNISPGQKLIVGYLQASGVPTTNVAASNPAPAPATTQPVATKTDVKVEPTQPQSQPVTEQKKAEPVSNQRAPEKQPAAPSTPQVAMGGAGYFKTQFEQQSKAANNEKSATASIFKTSSGWQDGKYYALMDNVEPGTIIRITNPTNNKAVYAKVLGEMSGIRQNQGLEVRISNAAASALDISDPNKFIVKVNY
ncbi:LysM peptidoglycan-binding domain-containing protein [Chitinophagaceae bacterium LB-8]|uniref:LysM peptidoglycan-binding domain-containing protein n=1 Tax=Paraflavisolibacter caeni TaxID=2982496 RepID=A0A9X2XP70_9BACT|nr:LysM peptidoglycan-binding domain-containing protein [Paraflavisolibacter caeni]MCU7550573.1 LysM peptidoglycan-binding domain-containing protein [Paraflavisolibacter caeni]